MPVKQSKPAGAKPMIFLLIFAALIVLAWWLWNRKRPHFVRYAEFGIELPANFPIHGIDVSRHQAFIDWDEVRHMQVDDVQLSFAFIKATEGLVNVDRQFKRNWKEAGEAGLTRGAYHFFLATKSGKTQAENFIRQVNLESGDLPPVIDVEQTYGVSPDRLRKNMKEFVETMEVYYGRKPILYTNVDFYNHYLKNYFDEYPLWVAHYLRKDKPRIAREWVFWQHSEEGRVNGIVNPVDFNVFNGDSADFQQLLVP
jgi:lysozyme